MLDHVFDTVLKMNLTALCTAGLLLPIKYVLQKIGCPRKVMFFLWAVIAFRLICPTSITSEFSLFNIAKLYDRPAATAVSAVHTISENEGVSYFQPTQKADFAAQEKEKIPEDGMKAVIGKYLAVLWLIGVSVMLMLGMLSYIALKRRLRYAVRYTDNIYICDGIPSSFVLGIFRPTIYIPSHTKKEDMEYIITHEKIHIRRLDHVTKIAGYILLSIHWINPLNWLMFRLLADDMEYACDESVINKIGFQNKKEYLDVLLDSAVKQKRMFYYNVCFAANSTKRRVKNMIKLKKRSRISGVIAVMLCTVLLAAFGTNAVTATNNPVLNTAENNATGQTSEMKPDGSDKLIQQEGYLSETKMQDSAEAENGEEKVYEDRIKADKDKYDENSDVNIRNTNQRKAESKIESVSGNDEIPGMQIKTDFSENTGNGVPDTAAPASNDAAEKEYAPSGSAVNTAADDSGTVLDSSTDVYAGNSVSRNDVENIKMGTHRAAVHDMLGTEGNSAKSGREEYKLNDGSTAVLIYDEAGQLTRGYIAENNE